MTPELRDMPRAMLEALYRAQGFRLELQEEQVREQAVLVQQLQAMIEVQARQVAELRAEVDRLQRRLSRNSGNSSMPPSSDGTLPGAPVPQPPVRAKTGRRRGRQQGTAGTTRRWAVPDEIVDHRPDGCCDGCGQALRDAASAGVVRRWQVIDIPVVSATVTEHRVHAVRCGCGRRVRATAAAGTPDAACTYGPNLVAVLVYLMVIHALPVARAAQVAADLVGVRASTGFVHGLLRRVAARLTAPTRAIIAGIAAAPAVGFDETTMRIGPAGERDYVWVAATDRFTLYHLGARSLAAFRAWNIGAHLGGAVVRDGYLVYDCTGAFAAQVVHQLCVAHLLRHLTDAAQTHPTHHWPAQIADTLRALVHAHHTAHEQGLPAIPAPIANPLKDAYRAAVTTGLTAVPRAPARKQSPARNLLECLDHDEADILRFAGDTRIPPTNNQAERDLRPHKTQQKISGRLTSHQVTRDRLTIRGYLATAIKHGRDAMTTLRDAVNGDPWIPPAAPADP